MSGTHFPRIPLVRPFVPQSTADGSLTFFSEEFGELFHSHHGAKQEAESKFVEPTRLRQKARDSKVLYLLDICYGLGYNTAAALEAIWEANPTCKIVWMGLESDVIVPKAAVTHDLLGAWSNEVQWRLAEIAQHHRFQDARLEAQLWIGDGRQTLQQVYQSGFRAEAIFLDPFSPPSCPQLWTVEFLRRVGDCLSPSGYLATYSCSATVRAALQEVGLALGSTHPVGRKTPGTVAAWPGRWLPPLSVREREHLQTRAAVPYRDPSLQDDAETIRQRRHQEQQQSSLEPTTRWKKRWRNSSEGAGLSTSDEMDDFGNTG